MPFIKTRTRKIRMIRHTSRLTEGNREALYAYARMLNDTTDYVLNQLIERVLATDKDFVAWRDDERNRAAPTPVTQPPNAEPVTGN
ncbi:MAG: hypothetical protein ACRD2X_18440 [Vicinamibacteraceae bacterium]